MKKIIAFSFIVAASFELSDIQQKANVQANNKEPL